MRALEKSVQHLAGSLDALEAKIGARLADLSSKSETIAAAQIKARTAKTQAAAASEDLADAIRDLRSLIGGEGR